MKYKPERDLPEFAREQKTVSPSKLVEIVLNRRNREVTPESVTMWFKRHPEIYDALNKELLDGVPTEKQAVDHSLFENGAFRETVSVKEWLLFMASRRRKGKPLHPKYVKVQVGVLRWLCRKYEKHPDRLTYRDAQQMFAALEDPKRDGKDALHWEGGKRVQGYDTCTFRRVMKDFLKSKGAADWEKIGVGKPSGFGHYKDLFVERAIVLDMLEWIETQDHQVYVLDELMYHTGMRLNAGRKATIENLKQTPEWDYLKVLEKFREEPTFRLTKKMGQLLQTLIGDRREGDIFDGLTDERVSKMNRATLKRFVPALEPKIEMPSHFFRHMCAQHLRKLTNGNSVACAAMMRCSKQSFDESYGGATQGEVEQWETQYLPMLD